MTKKVLVIVISDVSKKELREATTPNVDRLRAAGRSFPRFTSSPNSSSSRAKFVSGLYSHRKGNRVFADFEPDAERGALPAHPYDLGFATFRAHWLGKWHLTDGGDVGHAETCGFYHDGSLHDLDTGGGDYSRWLRTAGGTALAWEDSYATDFTALSTQACLRGDQVLVVAAFNGIHKPLHLPPSWVSRPDDDAPDYRDQRSSMLENVDERLGEILEVAFARDYQIVFFSDQAGPKADDEKGALYEKTLNVDLILAGSTVSGRGESDAVVDVTDLHATVWSWIVGLPPAVNDGTTLVGMAKPRRFAFADLAPRSDGSLPDAWDRSVRDVRCKLIANEWDAAGLGVATRSWEFYDLLKDPNEQENLIDRPEYVEKIDELKAALSVSFESPPGFATLAVTFRTEGGESA